MTRPKFRNDWKVPPFSEVECVNEAAVNRPHRKRDEIIWRVMEPYGTFSIVGGCIGVPGQIYIGVCPDCIFYPVSVDALNSISPNTKYTERF